MATEKKDSIPHVNKTQYHPPKHLPSLPPQQSICHRQQVCIWDVNSWPQFSTVFIFWINSFLKVTAAVKKPGDQWGKMPSCKVYTLAFLRCFFFVAHNKSQRETHARRRSHDLKRIPCSAAGWQLASPSVMVTPARKLHT